MVPLFYVHIVDFEAKKASVRDVMNGEFFLDTLIGTPGLVAHLAALVGSLVGVGQLEYFDHVDAFGHLLPHNNDFAIFLVAADVVKHTE
jgi:hypothetical protein